MQPAPMRDHAPVGQRQLRAERGEIEVNSVAAPDHQRDNCAASTTKPRISWFFFKRSPFQSIRFILMVRLYVGRMPLLGYGDCGLLGCRWTRLAQISAVLARRAARCLASPHAPIELVNHSRHIDPRFVIRRNAVIFVHCRRSRVVGGQSQRKVVVIPGQQRIEISRAAAHILARLETVLHAQVGRPSPASVASAARAGAAHGAGIAIALGLHHAGQQIHIEVVRLAGLGQHLVEIRRSLACRALPPAESPAAGLLPQRRNLGLQPAQSSVISSGRNSM